MWDCPCGCMSIAGSLTSCPMCFKEREMPRSVAGAQPSNQNAQPHEPGYIAPEPEPAEAAPEPVEVQPEPEPETQEPDTDAEARQWARDHGIVIPDDSPVPEYAVQAWLAGTGGD